jgi:hypothetical protein
MSMPFPVISPEYLKWLSNQSDDEPRTACESDYAGPWRILRLLAGDYGLLRLGEHPDRGDLPAAVVPSREYYCSSTGRVAAEVELGAAGGTQPPRVGSKLCR